MFDTVAVMCHGSQHQDKANPGKEAEYSEQFGFENALSTVYSLEAVKADLN